MSLIGRLTRQQSLQGLLRGAVGGLQQVMRRGSFDIPPSVERATERFKMEADPLRGFIEERVVARHPNNAPFISRTDVYNSYATWAAMNGFHQMSAQRFYESFAAAIVDISEFPVRIITRDGVRGYSGIDLRK